MRDGTCRHSPRRWRRWLRFGAASVSPGATSMPLSPLANPPRSDLLVMFGASGDLAKKKLFPAVYRLEKRGLLGVPVIGVALDDWSDDDLRTHARDRHRRGRRGVGRGRIRPPRRQHALRLGRLRRPRHVREAPKHRPVAPPTRSSTSPSPPRCSLRWPRASPRSASTRAPASSSRSRSAATSDSAVELNATLHAHFPESAIFRIDHFIGKEATAEPARHPVRQRHHRAAVEPQRGRPR